KRDWSSDVCSSDLLANIVSRDIIHADFCAVAAWGDTSLCEMAGCWLVCLAWVDLAIGDLDSVVAIVFYGANLGHNAWPSLDDGHRYNAVFLVKDLSHAELLAQNALDLVSHYYFSTKVLFVDHWILTSTLAGRSMRMRASTVFGVGSRMSMRRLWVRISKCSRESWYLCGERIPAYTFFSVGSGTGPTTRAPVRVTVSTIFFAEASIAS